MIGLLVLMIFGIWLLITVYLCKFSYRRLFVGEGSIKKSDVLLFFVVAAWFLASAWYFGGAKIYYDWRISDLCEVDGGVNIHKNIYLPKNKFNRWGQINFYNPTQGEGSLGDEYIYTRDVFYIFGTNEDDWLVAKKTIHKVFLKEENDLLAEQVLYIRSGGDFFSFGTNSAFFCPKIKSMSLFDSLFLTN